MGIKVANNAFATLASSITNSATSITLTTGQGARFPSLGAGDYFYATLIDTSNNLEIVKCTARSTDVLTVVRAQESTTARAYSAGDRIEIRLTAATFTDATQALPTQTGNAGKYLKTDGTNATWESISSVTPTSVSDQANSSTGYFDLPAGTTAQRPGSPGSGMVRFNTTIGEPEWYDPSSATWFKFSQGATYSVEYLVVAGGGGGAGGYVDGSGGVAGGGGGAGGMLTGTVTATPTSNYSVTVGGGGSAGPYSGSGSGTGDGTNGGNSSVFSQTAIGGGAGGARFGQNSGTGYSGGSGGASSGDTGGSGGSGTAGQGNAGGPSVGGTRSSSGGGGKSAAGTTHTNPNGSAGGDGQIWPSGGSTYYAGGGGGGGTTAGGSGVGGAGGLGGGGAGGAANSNAVAGTANTGGGGGGGGGGNGGAPVGGAGGSGVVILRYLGAQRGTGGTVTTVSGYTYHTFTTSGTFTA